MNIPYAVFNGAISLVFLMISWSIAKSLLRSGQLRFNTLGIEIILIFLASAVNHIVTILHSVPLSGSYALYRYANPQIDPIRLVCDWVLLVSGIGYLFSRNPHKKSLNGGQLYSDLRDRLFHKESQVQKSLDDIGLFQRALTTKLFPSIPGLTFDAYYQPAERDMNIGGDWYDIYPLSSGKVAFTIGDMTGHGMLAAIESSKIKEAIAAFAYTSDDPAQILAQANNLLCFRNQHIASAIFGTIDLKTYEVTYAIAGHPSPIFVESHNIVKSTPTGDIPLGVIPHTTYSNHTFKAVAGSTLVLYTDGLIEFNHDILDGEQRLLHAVAEVSSVHTVSPARRLMSNVLGSYTSQDDLAILMIRFEASPLTVEAGIGKRWSTNIKDEHQCALLRTEIMKEIQESAPTLDQISAELVIGELLSNVTRHTPGDVVVETSIESDRVRVLISDNGPGIPLTYGLPETFSESGRGMYIVHSLAKSVILTRTDSGSTIAVTFALPIISELIQETDSDMVISLGK